MVRKTAKHWVPGWKGRLGPLQSEIMELILSAGKEGVPARFIFEVMYERQKLPMASVYTVLNRLIKRGLLKREKIDEIYHYRPLIKKKELGRFGSFDDKRHERGTKELVSFLLRQGNDYTMEEIEELERILEKEKQKLRQKD